MEGGLTMTEEQVTRSIIKWLVDSGWEILDYDFPGGGTGRKFHIRNGGSDKTKGIVIPDVIALRNDVILILENKSVDTLSDYEKIKQLAESSDFRGQLKAAYPDVGIAKIVWGIGFSGQQKYISQAAASNVNVVVNVIGDTVETASCNVIYGVL